MLHLNQPGGPRHVRLIPDGRGVRTIPPIDDIENGIARGATPREAVAAWWATQPAEDRETARRDGYYVG